MATEQVGVQFRHCIIGGGKKRKSMAALGIISSGYFRTKTHTARGSHPPRRVVEPISVEIHLKRCAISAVTCYYLHSIISMDYNK